MTTDKLTLDFGEIGLKDLPRVGGKNASLGEMFNALKDQGVGVLDGFATTVAAYRVFLQTNGLQQRLESILEGVDGGDLDKLESRGLAARGAIMETALPQDLQNAIRASYERLAARLGRTPSLAVRSSATAEDLPDASFAGAAETFLNVDEPAGLIRAVQACFASLFTDRAISYRARIGYGQAKVGISVGIMPMVRSDKGSSGVMFTLDPETGFRDVVLVSSSYGLGEFVVQGVVTPDEWIVHKPTLEQGFRPIVSRRLGTKEVRLVYGDGSVRTRSETTPAADRAVFSLSDNEVLTLARWGCIIEAHYSAAASRRQPMDIEWAKDGITGELFIVQARPETVHSSKPMGAAAERYRLKSKPGTVLVTGQAVGSKIGTGVARVVSGVNELQEIHAGDVLVARNTDPDWEPVMRQVAAIVTDEGGRTAHAAIISREFGLPCIVGTGNATQKLKTGDAVTVCCAEGAEGHVYSGKLDFDVEQIESSSVPKTRTTIMLTLGNPEQAFARGLSPHGGVGLARIEFIIANQIGIHPMALVRYPNLRDLAAIRDIRSRIGAENPREYFVRRLAEGVGRIAAAFYPRPVIVRTSDFKSNEYAALVGGKEFEPGEENPMLGFRGASRYYDDRYSAGFALECEALSRVRQDMGLVNVKIMIPFCRTVDEGRKVISVMAANGLKQGELGLEIYAMCELPSNVLQTGEFLKIFDGYSIGSNDLTQLVLGVDRDSGTVSHLFDERNQAVRQMIANAISAAHIAGKPIGICGQAPSDYPDFAAWLVGCGIDSISLNPDTAIPTAFVIAAAERQQKTGRADAHIERLAVAHSGTADTAGTVGGIVGAHDLAGFYASQR